MEAEARGLADALTKGMVEQLLPRFCSFKPSVIPSGG